MFPKLRNNWPRIREQINDLYGMNRRNVELVYAHNPRENYPYADDKLLCKELLEKHGIPVAETLAVCRGLFEVADTLNHLRDCESFVIKPCNGSGGDGIIVTGKRKNQGWETPKDWVSDGEVYQHLANIVFGGFSKQMEDRALIEKRLIPHPLFIEFWDKGVCDVRIIVLKGVPIMSMVRVPTTQSEGKANLHQGGIGVAVALKSGRTFRAISKGELVDTHPESGVQMLDRQIPHWDACIDIAIRASEVVPLDYLGVDIVIDEDLGPLILELNARPGLEIQNVNHKSLGTAMREQGVSCET